MAVLIGCAPAGAEVVAQIEPAQLGGVYSDTYWLQVRAADGDPSFPAQIVRTESTDPVVTLTAEPLDEATCIQVLVQSIAYFDLPAKPFSYVVDW
jgi:hypothetical protein